MKKYSLCLAQAFFATLLFLIVLEMISLAAGFTQGATAYIESIILKENISPRKPSSEVRIFAYGESTIQGAQYAPVSSPIQWLREYLKDFLPHKKIRVVNFSRSGFGSEFAYDALQDTIAYKPDLAVFYLGHNDFLPLNRFDDVQAAKRSLSYRAKILLRKSRFISFVLRQAEKARIRRKRFSGDSMEYMSIETEPLKLLSQNLTNEEKSFCKGGVLYQTNITRFKSNLIRILDLAERNKIQTLFFIPVGNLKDFTPNRSERLKALSEKESSTWQDLYQKGREREEQGALTKALDFYEKAYVLDPTYAELPFRLGKIYFQMGDFEKARWLFEEARDNDTIINRATSDVLHVYAELKRSRTLNLIDTEKLLAPEAPGGIMGEPIIEDNVHFSIKGHSLTGKALSVEIANRNWIAPKNEWRFENERSYEEISKALGVDENCLFTAYLRLVSYFNRRYENRLDYVSKALAIRPNDPRALRYLAWTYWLIGKREEALSIYNRLDLIDPSTFKEVLKAQPQIARLIRKSLSRARSLSTVEHPFVA